MCFEIGHQPPDLPDHVVLLIYELTPDNIFLLCSKIRPSVYHPKRKDIQIFWRTRHAHDSLGMRGRISGMFTEPGDSEKNSWVLQKVVALL
jgi:hypothetical protein